MAIKGRKWTVSGVVTALMGFVCALLLAVLFYGMMVYQLAGEHAVQEEAAQAGGLLTLGAGELVGEETTREKVGGMLCTVVTRSYQLEDGALARAVTATPAAYIERLSGKGVDMQLITGYVIDDLDAVFALSGEGAMLAARSGDRVYVIEGVLDQQTLYALGAGARRESTN